MAHVVADHVTFAVNSALDPQALSDQFLRARRVHIPSFLDGPGATALYEHLTTEIDWSYFAFGQGHLWEVSPETRRNYSPEQERALHEMAYTEARNGYAFIYETNRLTTRDGSGAVKRAQHTPLVQQFLSFLNSPALLQFARQLSGIQELSRAEATATCFRPGHFLAFHDDSSTSTRRLAYVLNLTRTWRPEWGGLLEFMGADGHIAEAYVPRFNSFNVFQVPQAHQVSCVAPFAVGPRVAISGWLHA
jgi:Rps23 Pro-64 3,4-dihydroxylase Tpa1-like proline 4-hydroxylase